MTPVLIALVVPGGALALAYGLAWAIGRKVGV